MADKTESEKTLEMRVAELEDKLKNLHVTEDEMKAYNKVASLMGGGGGTAAAATGLTPQPDACIRACTIVQQCTIHACTINPWAVHACTIRACTIRACTIRQC